MAKDRNRELFEQIKKEDPGSVLRESELSEKEKAMVLAKIRRKKIKKKDPSSVVREGEME